MTSSADERSAFAFRLLDRFPFAHADKNASGVVFSATFIGCVDQGWADSSQRGHWQQNGPHLLVGYVAQYTVGGQQHDVAILRRKLAKVGKRTFFRTQGPRNDVLDRKSV